MTSSLLPPNATPLERALDETLAARIEAIDLTPTSALWNPATCPADLLPWLAWAEGVDEWSSAWSVAVQRAVIAAQREIRRRRGTRSSVAEAIAAFGGSVVMKEWWEHSTPRTPHTFDVVISGGADYIDAGFQQSMMRAIERNKPARSRYTLGIGITAAGHIGLAGVARVATYKRMEFTA